MPGKRQKYTREYKIEAVRLSMEPGKTAAQAAAELGIPAGQLYKWKREYEREGNTAFPGNGVVNSRDEELHRLRRELKRVTEERDFLKKTAADLPRSRDEVRLHPRERRCLWRTHDVSALARIASGLLRLAWTRSIPTPA